MDQDSKKNSPPDTGKAKKPEGRRLEILNAAQGLFFSKGYEATSITDVLNAVGIAKGTFYHHFKSKEQLLHSIIERYTVGIQEKIQGVIDEPNLDALTKFHRIFDVTGQFKMQHKTEVLLMMETFYSSENIRLREEWTSRSHAIISQLLGKVIQSGVREGVFHTSDPYATAEMAMYLNQYVSSLMPVLLNSDGDRKAWDEYIRRIEFWQVGIQRLLGAPENSIQIIRSGLMEEFWKFVQPWIMDRATRKTGDK